MITFVSILHFIANNQVVDHISQYQCVAEAEQDNTYTEISTPTKLTAKSNPTYNTHALSTNEEIEGNRLSPEVSDRGDGDAEIYFYADPSRDVKVGFYHNSLYSDKNILNTSYRDGDADNIDPSTTYQQADVYQNVENGYQAVGSGGNDPFYIVVEPEEQTDSYSNA